MSLYDPTNQIAGRAGEAVNVQSLLHRVFFWMALGLLTTATVAYLTISTSLITLVANRGVFFAAIIGELALVVALNFGLRRMSPGLATALFFVYAGVNGFTLSIIFLVYQVGVIYQAFLATAVLFGAMAVVGYVTDIDLTRIGSFLVMGVIGLLVAMIVNMFLNSGPLDYVITIAGVLIFTGLTAYDTQRIKRMAEDPALQGESEMVTKVGIIAALKLYLDFINLFLFLLRLFGGRRR